jgi:uncharacterized protein YaeQ
MVRAMALGATMHRFVLGLADIDRGVHEALDLRVARHPSESARHLWLRVLAHALSFEAGLAFSKGGLSDADAPALELRDATGALLAWIDVGAPSAERLHRAAKLAPRVEVFTTQDLAALRREAAAGAIHRAPAITVHRIDAALVAALEARLERQVRLEVTRSGGHLYLSVEGEALDGPVESGPLAS